MVRIKKKAEETEMWNRFNIIPMGYIDSMIDEKFSFPLSCSFKGYYQEEIISQGKLKGKVVVLKLKDSQGITLSLKECLNGIEDKDEERYLIASSIRLNVRQTPKSKQLYGTLQAKTVEELKNSPSLLKEIWDRYKIKLFYNNEKVIEN